MIFKVNQRLSINSTKVQLITLTQHWYYTLASEANLMPREQLEREIEVGQNELVALVPVREQIANDMVHSVFQRSSGNFCESNVLPNTTTTYTKLEHSL